MKNLLGRDTNPKTVKGQKFDYLTAILYLAPHKSSGVMNVCSNASPGCIFGCLNTSGHGGMTQKDGRNIVQEARQAKTQFLFAQRAEFMAQLDKEIKLFIKYVADKNKKDGTNFKPAIRLNGTSDLSWEDANFTGGIMQRYPDVQFYDYTKIAVRAIKWANGLMPANYHLTFSYSETAKNHLEAADVINAGGNVAVVFSSPNFPEKFLGVDVINGDEHDLRFTDKKNVVVGLKAKGKAKKDTSGFVVQI